MSTSPEVYRPEARRGNFNGWAFLENRWKDGALLLGGVGLTVGAVASVAGLVFIPLLPIAGALTLGGAALAGYGLLSRRK